jgi:hypothetical protein
MESSQPRRRRVGRALLIALAVVVALLVIARALLPTVIQRYANRWLDESKDYAGHVGDVDLALWRGAAQVNDVVVYQRSVSMEQPFVKVRRATGNVSWLRLLGGKIVTSAQLDAPEVTVPADPSRETKAEQAEQVEEAEEGKEKVEEAPIPFHLERLVVRNGKVHIFKRDAKPQVLASIDDVDVEARHFAIDFESPETRIATVRATGRPMGKTPLSVDVSIDQTQKDLAFDLQGKLLDFPVEALNPILKHYAKFDFEAGELDFVTEMSVRAGKMDGYVKPLFRDVKVLGRDDKVKDKDTLAERAWEGLVGAVEEVFENQKKDQAGLKLTVKGDLDSPKPGVMDAVVSVLRNAFVRALTPVYERGDAH